jgi:hypothetical protein
MVCSDGGTVSQGSDAGRPCSVVSISSLMHFQQKNGLVWFLVGCSVETWQVEIGEGIERSNTHEDQ